MIKTILLAVDLSVFTSCLLHHAADLAKKHQAKLIAVHAVEPLGNLGHALINAYLTLESRRALTTTGLDAMIKEVKSQVIDALTEEYMNAGAEHLNLGEVIVKSGNPADVILQAADEADADLIVLGSHSPNLSIPASLGTVAQKVLSFSKVPAYIVPNSDIGYQQSDNRSQMRLW